MRETQGTREKSRQAEKAQEMRLALFKVAGTKGGNQVVEIHDTYSKCVLSDTKRKCQQYIKNGGKVEKAK
jgi:hypothetical protein